ncbi:hypothetical protein HDU86_005207 [Geranomyces michiganensis]|nr:hypothetical protein HDU86_005207 [Geranomyces michiganensis]
MLRYTQLALATISVTSAATDPFCRCLSTDASCWPSASAFVSLNSSVDGRLVKIHPLSAVCYSNHDAYNPTACKAAQHNFFNPFFRADQMGAVMYDKNVAFVNGTDVCPLVPRSSTAVCGQGQVSPMGVRAVTVRDVQQTVKFAAKYNLRLAVKSSGHDQSGRSAAAGSLLLWLHDMRGIQFHDSFIPTHCSPGSAGTFTSVKVAAGETWGAVYAAAEKRNLTVVGGACLTVGAAGGFVQGGGNGPLSRSFGLASDNVLQYEVVTADGRVRIANACANRDLFWALRGGGGGTFAVVTSVVYKAYRSPKMASALYTIDAPKTSTAGIRPVLQYFIDTQLKLEKTGLSGYIGFAPTNMNFMFFQPNGTRATIAAALQPLLDFAAAKRYTVQGSTMEAPTYFGNYYATQCAAYPGTCTEAVGENAALGSRLISAAQFNNQSDRNALASTIQSILSTDGAQFLLIQLVAGGAVSSFSLSSSAVHPSWRRALWHVVVANGWENAASPATIAATRAATTKQTQRLRKLAPDMGAYVNEADEAEPDFRMTFWGEHYPRLAEIKANVDPKGLFYCRWCVGSEEWSADGNCRV